MLLEPKNPLFEAISLLVPLGSHLIIDNYHS